MAGSYTGKVAGHALRSGRMAVRHFYGSRGGGSAKAVCECGAESPTDLDTVVKRIEWHRQHKSDMLDTFVHRGYDDRGREVYL